MRLDEKYKVYIDTTAQSEWVWNDDTNSSWVQVYPDISPFQWKLVDNEYFHRYSWGQITFRNRPDESSSLFDDISNLDISQEIRIKVVTSKRTIRGYFGANDCEYNADNSVLTVEPAVLDKYTDIMENRETKIDLNGDQQTYRARWEKGSYTSPITATHRLPLSLVSKNLDEARSQSFGSVLGLSSIVSNTKSGYGLIFKGSINGEITISPEIGAAGTSTYYMRERNALNVIIQEKVIGVADYSDLDSYADLKATITIPIEVNMNVSAQSYVSIDCEVTGIVGITYSLIDVTVLATEELLNSSDITLNLAPVELQTLQIWTEVRHGRASPQKNDWEDSDGIEGYFDSLNGRPLTGTGETFQLSDFGPNAGAGAYISNGADMQTLEIESLYLGDIESAIEEFKYELKSVTVYTEDGFYRAGFKRKKRVYATCEFAREEYWKAEINDPPPSSAGWVPASEDDGGWFDASGRQLYIRKPYNGTIDSWSLGDVTGEENDKFYTDGFEYEHSLTSVKNYPPREDTQNEYSTARDLRDVISTAYSGATDKLQGKGVYSTFFWNDNEGSLPYFSTVASGTNYVTGLNPNRLNRISCVNTSDFDTSDTEITDDDRVLEMSFKDLMDDLKMLFNVYWFLDDDQNLYVEHIKYLDLIRPSAPNTVTSQKSIDQTLKYDFDKSEMFATINHNTANAAYPDFTNNYRTFDRIASNKRNDDLRLELKTEYITTDVKYCIESATSLDDTGLCLIAHDENNVMLSANAQFAGGSVENGDLALSTLLNNYWRYEGVWLNGEINGVAKEFEKTIRTRIGKPIFLQGTYDKTITGEDVMYITTNLGVGLVKSLSIDLERFITEDVTLMYRFTSLTQDSGGLKSGEITEDFELITDDAGTLFDFDNS